VFLVPEFARLLGCDRSHDLGAFDLARLAEHGQQYDSCLRREREQGSPSVSARSARREPQTPTVRWSPGFRPTGGSDGGVAVGVEGDVERGGKSGQQAHGYLVYFQMV
jgi:hypothetical protein